MSRQLLKQGTSIEANIREAEFAQSKLDFISRMSISLKEVNETEYWLELLNKTGYLDTLKFDLMQSKSSELIKLLASIVKTSKKIS